MEVIVGEFGIVVVPRDGADPERIMNHSSILRKYKVSERVHVGPGKAARGLMVSLRPGGHFCHGTQSISGSGALS